MPLTFTGIVDKIGPVFLLYNWLKLTKNFQMSVSPWLLRLKVKSEFT